MRKQIVFGIGLITLFFAPISAVWADPIALPSGVEYKAESLTQHDGSHVMMRSLKVNPTQAQVRIEGQGGPDQCTATLSPGEINTLAGDNSFIAAINAQFFRSGTGGDNSVIGDYIGNAVYFDENWESMRRESNFIGVRHDGEIILGSSAALTQEVVSRYSMFFNGVFKINRSGYLTNISDANISAAFASAYSHPGNDQSGPISRTFLGVDTNHNTLILLTGGSGNDRDHGVYPIDAVRYLAGLGATDGYILDAGGSTLMKVAPRLVSANAGLTNAPNDGRALGDLLVIRTGGPQTQEEVARLPVKHCREGATPAPQQPTTPQQPAAPGQAQPQQPAQVQVTNPVSQPAQVALPPQTIALEVPIGDINTINGAQNYILSYARVIFTYIAGLAGILALLMLIISGFQIMLGGPEEIGKAKERISGSLAGLIILASGGFILYMINPCFFGFSATATCTPRGTGGGSVAVVNQVVTNPGAGGGAVSQPLTTTNNGSGLGPTANVQMIATVNRLAQVNASLPRLSTTGSSNPAVPNIAYPRVGGGYTFYPLKSSGSDTDNDKLWMGRMVEYEGGASNPNFGAEIIWIVVQRYAWEGRLGSQSFAAFMRDFSQPIDSDRTTHPEALTRSYDSLNANTKRQVEAFFNGTLPNPVPGIVDFASQRSQGVGWRCDEARNPTSSVVYVRNNSTRSESFSAPADHSQDDCNAVADHFYVGRHSGRLSTDAGYERIQVALP